jgi:hypothetical protein
MGIVAFVLMQQSAEVIDDASLLRLVATQRTRLHILNCSLAMSDLCTAWLT